MVSEHFSGRRIHVLLGFFTFTPCLPISQIPTQRHRYACTTLYRAGTAAHVDPDTAKRRLTVNYPLTRPDFFPEQSGIPPMAFFLWIPGR